MNPSQRLSIQTADVTEFMEKHHLGPIKLNKDGEPPGARFAYVDFGIDPQREMREYAEFRDRFLALFNSVANDLPKSARESFARAAMPLLDKVQNIVYGDSAKESTADALQEMENSLHGLRLLIHSLVAAQ